MRIEGPEALDFVFRMGSTVTALMSRVPLSFGPPDSSCFKDGLDMTCSWYFSTHFGVKTHGVRQDVFPGIRWFILKAVTVGWGLVKTLWHQELPGKNIPQMCCRGGKTPDLLPERSGFRQSSTIFSQSPGWHDSLGNPYNFRPDQPQGSAGPHSSKNIACVNQTLKRLAEKEHQIWF